MCIGHDSIMDPWYPMGKGSMLAAANLLLHTAHMSGYSQVFRLFRMITGNSAETLGVSDSYGIAPEKMRASSCSTRKMNLTPFVCRVNVSGRCGGAGSFRSQCRQLVR